METRLWYFIVFIIILLIILVIYLYFRKDKPVYDCDFSFMLDRQSTKRQIKSARSYIEAKSNRSHKDTCPSIKSTQSEQIPILSELPKPKPIKIRLKKKGNTNGPLKKMDPSENDPVNTDPINTDPINTDPINTTNPFGGSFKSKGETICRQVLEDIYKKPFPSCRPDFLKNPKTRCNLELDGYNEELGIAFEYNGLQHYRFPNPFHKTKEALIYQVQKDQYKHKVCDDKNIYLITIPFDIKHNQIREFIEYWLPENVMARKELENIDYNDDEDDRL